MPSEDIDSTVGVQDAPSTEAPAPDNWNPLEASTAEAEAAKEDAPDAEAIKAEARASWDGERQKEQEANASARKSLEREIDSRDRQIEDLRSDATKAHESLVAVNKDIADLKRSRETADVDPDATPEEKAAIRQQQALMDTLGKINDRLETIETKTIPGLMYHFEQAGAAAANQGALDRECASLDGEFGAQHRNAAVELTKKTIAADGFNAEKLPPAAYTSRTLRAAYEKIAGENGKAAPTKGKKPRLDTGRGGSTGSKRKPKTGTLAEVLADMTTNGEIPTSDDM